jgi:5-methylcytosine-specific restriction enzyme subunit McrC
LTVLYDPLTAWNRGEQRELPDEHAAAMQQTGVVSVSPGDAPGMWSLGTDSRVGVLVGDGWQIGIRPRLNIPRLLFLLAYSLRPEGWKRTHAIFESAAQIEDAVAAGFAVHAEEAIRAGVLHGYVGVETSEHTIRGRIRFADQMSRSAGLPLPVQISYDDFTANILENRMLLTTAEVLLRFPLIPPQARIMLLRIRALLPDVEPLGDPRAAKAPTTTRINERYAPALALAELVLRGSSVGSEHGSSSVISTSFVFDMNEVFESFLSTRLTARLRRYGGWVNRQQPAQLAPGLNMRTDVTWHGPEGLRAVVDAKYKSLVDRSTMPNADAYQMLAYCVALSLPRGYLIYAKDSGEAERNHRIVRHGYELHVRSVDVEVDPETLLAQVDSIADAIAETWQSGLQLAA